MLYAEYTPDNISTLTFHQQDSLDYYDTCIISLSYTYNITKYPVIGISHCTSPEGLLQNKKMIVRDYCMQEKVMLAVKYRKSLLTPSKGTV